LDLTGSVTLNLQDLAAISEPIDLGTKFTLISYSGEWNGGVFDGFADDSTFAHGGNPCPVGFAEPLGAAAAIGLRTREPLLESPPSLPSNPPFLPSCEPAISS